MSSKDANLYIHDSAAGGYPILISYDDETAHTKDENMVWRDYTPKKIQNNFYSC
jgi:hypothetical protein